VRGAEKWSEEETDLLRRLREERPSLSGRGFVKWVIGTEMFRGRTAKALTKKPSRLESFEGLHDQSSD
jgi:hypothetical protein